ncbi:MAG TPA: cytidine deaminase [Hellea balneolensis]|uniref:Cytidine deaminase n=1 Tax=Hellea balneolensis TaxID=287478 RepID=A0A7C3G8P1_9PROT|nr:cytidine deaminase [Hellea balneolensis]
MTATLKPELFSKALHVMSHAHAPYSRFHVGAAVLADNGHIYHGCNVENASYPEGLCAEAGAISAMIADGGRRIQQICIVGAYDDTAAPCGGCRQKILEFADGDTPVFICSPNGVQKTYRLDELLPHPFRSANLKTAQKETT